jgi:hypothetical protein
MHKQEAKMKKQITMLKILTVGMLFICNIHASFAFDAPIFVVNDQVIDGDFYLNDFYLYEGTLFNYVFARITNTGSRYFEFVKLKYDLYKNDVLVKSDLAFVQYSTYGADGMAPNTTSYASAFLDKVEFDRIHFYMDYTYGDGTGYLFNDQALVAYDTKVEELTSSSWKVSGFVKSRALQDIKFPTVIVGLFKDNHCICNRLAFVNVGESTLKPGESGDFFTFMEMPPAWDEVKYFPNYAVYATGNITVGVSQRTDGAGDFFLDQNYPNPFNSSTTLCYSLPVSSNVTIIAYNVLGRMVKKLFDGTVSAGVHTLVWQADDLPTGQYFIKLRSEGVEKIIRCSYIK